MRMAPDRPPFLIVEVPLEEIESTPTLTAARGNPVVKSA
jgi:hypothetical protein